MGNLGYLTKEGFRNLKVNKLMSIASVTVLFSCLFLIGMAFMIIVNIGSFISNIEAENVIMVFIADEATEQDAQKLGSDIEAINGVATVDFVPKEEGYTQIISDLDENLKVYLENLDENPMPDAYRVTVENMNEFDSIVSEIKLFDNVLRVRENSALARQLTDMRDSVTYISAGIILLLLIVSLFIISNTIKVTMFSRRLEISIMKSVGATNSFIRWPFMVEGVIIGVISGILATFAVWGVYEIAIGSFSNILLTFGGSVEVKFTDYVLWIALAFIVIGVFTGVFGSASSMRKYLKERKFVELEK